MIDLLIRNGLVTDGSGEKPYYADVAITGPKIMKIAPHIDEVAVRTYDAAGKAVAPGFIDMHTHSDAAPLLDYVPDSKIRQGVTFELNGNCGLSFIPADKAHKKEINAYFTSNTELTVSHDLLQPDSLEEYAAAVSRSGTPLHYGVLIGHGALRGTVMGFDDRVPTAAEQQAMEDLLDREMAAGAFGMSLGLIYPPSAFAKPEEIIGLAKVVRRHDGLLTVHIRNEGPRVFEALQEMLGIAAASGVHLEISHLKIMNKPLWGQSDRLLAMIDRARKQGIRVDCDQYPFFTSSTSLIAVLPRWSHSGGMEQLQKRVLSPTEDLLRDISAEIESRGGAERILITGTHGFHPEWAGKTVWDLAEEWNRPAAETVTEILRQCECSVSCDYFSQAEEDRDRILSREDICVISDGYSLSLDPKITTGTPHPRNFCTFPHALELARKKKLMSMEKMIRKMTLLPAERIGLKQRGLLKEGYWADITVFNPETIGQTGGYLNPVKEPHGIEMVIVDGQIILEDHCLTGNRPGGVIRHR